MRLSPIFSHAHFLRMSHTRLIPVFLAVLAVSFAPAPPPYSAVPPLFAGPEGPSMAHREEVGIGRLET
jgi:hypothetical protein